MKKCPNCKRQIDDNSSFCEFCGCQIKHSKKPLWIALGAIAVAALLFVLLKPKNEPKQVDLDTQAYQACQTVDDYRAYICDYGRNALHYTEAKAFVDHYVADSLQRLLDSLAQARAQEQAEAGMRQEDEAYQKCTTVAACDSYLNDYPNGRYADQVRAKKDELEQKQVQQQTQQQTQQRSQQQTTHNTPTGGNSGGSGSTTGTTNGHEWVDLGLPSGTLWATCNIGANKSEGYGNYYAWGETSTKDNYKWDTYKYANGSYNKNDKLTKYCNKSDYGDNGFTDNLTTLQVGDDPAAAWGSGWHTPSKVQCDELLANTKREWTTQNGVKGYKFTSKKNGQSVFLPAAGFCFVGGLDSAGSDGYYWTRSLYTNLPEYAWRLHFGSDRCDVDSGGLYRFTGFSVRPVREK